MLNSTNRNECCQMVIAQYTYDNANQLLSEELPGQQKTVWTYDNAGNIQTRTAYTWENESWVAKPEVTYNYNDTTWGDLLTEYNEKDFYYDDIGNLTDDSTWNYTWQHGRQLASMVKADTSVTWNYSYDADGLRTKRTNGSETWEYVYNGSQLVEMTKGNNTLYFTYDAAGTPTAMTLNGETTYYYATNLQGDIIAILDDEGQLVAEYSYDAWGNPIGTISTTGITALNPLRYRGYVYDSETGLYYLQSRYYNPEIGRFLNADGLVATGQGILGNNMFAYCGNNPVNYKDPSGHSLVLAMVGITILATALVLSGCEYTQETHSTELKSAPDLDINTAPPDTYNCYGNAIGKQIDTSPYGFSKGDSAETVFAAVQHDLGESNVTRLNSINDPIGPDEYMVALRCGPADYHFIRKDENGWFNKVGDEKGYYIDESIFSIDKWRFGESDGVMYLPSITYYEGDIIYFSVKVGWDAQ